MHIIRTKKIDMKDKINRELEICAKLSPSERMAKNIRDLEKRFLNKKKDQYGGKTRAGGLSPDTGPRN